MFLGFLSNLGLSEVQATEEGIARATYGHGVGASLWRYSDVLHFSLIPRERSGKPFGLLILVTRTGVVTLGLSDSVPGEDVIEFLRRRGIQEATFATAT